MAVLGRNDGSQTLADEDLARLAIDAESEELRAMVGSVGQPNAVLPDHGRRPRFAGNGCLPDDVRAFAPVEGQPDGVAVALIGGAPIACPEFIGMEGGARRKEKAGDRGEGTW